MKDYYKSLEEAPYDVLEEYEGTVLAALEDYQSIGDEKEVKELEKDLMRVRDLMNKKGGKECLVTITHREKETYTIINRHCPTLIQQ